VQEDERPVALEFPEAETDMESKKAFPALADEVASLRRKVKWLAAGVGLAFLFSLAWPVALVLISRHAPWAREFVRSIISDNKNTRPRARPEERAGLPNESHTGEAWRSGEEGGAGDRGIVSGQVGSLWDRLDGAKVEEVR